jgi:chemotaxis family two-component system response regulator Rcp1
MNENLHVIHVLLVEDNETDVLIAREALREARVLNQLHRVEDGEEAMKFLRQEGPFAEAPRPDLILLDLNLPKKGGQEVLAEIKRDPALLCIPVVILTTSSAHEDVLRAYGMHANSYVTKPLDFEAFGQVLKSMEQFWLCVVTLPNSAIS